MKVFIAGASGRVGRALTEILIQRGVGVVAGCRHPESIEKRDLVEPVRFDLLASPEEMAPKLTNVDAVYCVAGSRGKDLLQTDAFGVVKLIQATEETPTRRFILLSSIFALAPGKWKDEESLKGIINYDIAKFFADSWLVRNSDLDYTIVQPSVLTEEEPLGKIDIDPDSAGTNPIPDVATVLADVLQKKNTYRKVIMLRSGATPIAEALESL